MPTAAEQRVHEFAGAVTNGDADKAVAQCHPAVEFYSVLASVEGEAFTGHDGIRRYFEEFLGTLDEWRVELDRVVEVPDGRVAATMTMYVRGRRSGASLAQDVGHVWELEDGKLRRCTAFRSGAEALAAAGTG